MKVRLKCRPYTLLRVLVDLRGNRHVTLRSDIVFND
jgi:hypothetical protein